jgi:hypothetical protein
MSRKSVASYGEESKNRFQKKGDGRRVDDDTRASTDLIDVELGQSDRNAMDLVKVQDEIDEILELLVSALGRERREAFEQAFV